MKDFNIRTMLRARLTPRKNRDYLSWIHDVCPGLVGHHVTGSSLKTKLHDLLIAKIPDEIHQKVENGIEVAGYSDEEMLMNAIDWNHKYIEYLQEENRQLKKEAKK